MHCAAATIWHAVAFVHLCHGGNWQGCDMCVSKDTCLLNFVMCKILISMCLVSCSVMVGDEIIDALPFFLVETNVNRSKVCEIMKYCGLFAKQVLCVCVRKRALRVFQSMSNSFKMWTCPYYRYRMKALQGLRCRQICDVELKDPSFNFDRSVNIFYEKQGRSETNGSKH